METFTKLKGIGICIIICLILVSFSHPAFSQESRQKQSFYGKHADEMLKGAVFISQSPESAYPSSVKFAENSGVTESNFVQWFKKSFNVPAGTDLVLVKTETDELGFTHQRYTQIYNSLPVDRSGIVVQFKNGQATSFNGDFFPVENVNTEPGLRESEALYYAMHHVGAETYMWEDTRWESEIKQRLKDEKATYYPKGELVITKFSNSASTSIKPVYRLAYQFDIHALSPSTEQRVFVDASSGEILYTLPLASDCEPPVNFTSIFNGTRSVQTDFFSDPNYRLNDDCLAAEVHVWDWNSATSTPSAIEIQNTTNTWTTMDERFGASVLWETKQSYAYFKNIHSRNSYDHADGDVNAFINAVFYSSSCACDYTDNASMSFTGGTMKVGLGSSGTLANSWSSVDIIGHEYTHAVTGSSSLLVYQGESGALNESFSDIFGEMIERYVEGSNDWLMGDDRTDGAIRDMSDPNDFSDPDTYMGDFWKNTCVGCSDNGGVHSNSGVQNFWFNLLTVGGSGTNDNDDDYSVSGIGITKASAIAFRNQTLKLSANSDYAAARAGAIEAAEDLYGACSDEVKQTTNAWYAVGVGDPYCEAVLESPLKPGGFNVSCYGGSDGEIDLTPLGTAPFTFVWDDGPVTEDRSGLSAGSYGVTITDATGCSDYASITIVAPTELSASAVVTSNYNGYAVSCFGGSDGEAMASGSGGAPPYSFLWDAGAGNQATANATGLSASTYDVTVTDANGCTAQAQVTLDEPPELMIDAGPNQTVYFGYPPMACATLTYSGESGGVPPYSFEWSTGETTQSIEVCPQVSTEYTITITDANNCSATDAVVVCAIDVRCGKNLDKVEICHMPPGNPGNSQTLCVALSAVATHLAHGDMLAACGTDHSCTGLDAKTTPLSGNSVAEPGLELKASPNPFNQSTLISFSTEIEGQAILKLVDQTGRGGKVLFNQNVEQHLPYEIELARADLKSGIYYLMLIQQDGNIKTIKVLVND
jgi:Zn-dependent metalloprotease